MVLFNLSIIDVYGYFTDRGVRVKIKAGKCEAAEAFRGVVAL